MQKSEMRFWFANFVISLFLTPIIAESQLRFVQAIWRHGDRAPSKLAYPNDPYDESYWPYGWSQLTDLGAEQLADLGQFFRSRYIGSFINDTYRSNEVYVQSSESDRALSSAQAFLDGMYGLNRCSDSRGFIVRAPIPVHSTGRGLDDYLLKPTSVDCPAYDRAFEQHSSGLLTKLAKSYADFYQFLGNVTGFGEEMSTEQVTRLSSIVREITHNLTQPNWVFRRWPQYNNSSTLDLIQSIDRQVRINEFEHERLHHLRGGPLLGDWLQRGLAVTHGKQITPSKMQLYSSHDGTVLSLMYALKIADGEQIPYTGCVIMEVHEAEDGKFTVKLFYRKNGQLLLKTVPGCTEVCPMDKFSALLNKNAVFSLKKAAKNCDKSRSSSGEFKDLNSN